MNQVLSNKASGQANADEPNDPDATLKAGGGICVDIARLFVELAKSSGLESKEVSGITKNSSYQPMLKVCLSTSRKASLSPFPVHSCYFACSFPNIMHSFFSPKLRELDPLTPKNDTGRAPV